jgi:tellurite resistance protein TerC
MSWLHWGGFALFVVAVLLIDLGILNKKQHEISLKESLTWSAVWIFIAFLFTLVLAYYREANDALEFTTAYLVEKSLSVDNVFVFVMIFAAWKIPALYQHRVLFYGIIGAIIMRGIFLFAGVALIQKFHWMIYIFGFILLYTAYKLMFVEEKGVDYQKHPVIKLLERCIPIEKDIQCESFFIKKDNRWHATPLFIVLILVELTDLMFAIDSIPAVLAITDDLFILYTSNVFALFGLRMLYFALSHILKYFVYLKYGLSLILGFVGLKMIASGYMKVPPYLSLGVIGTILAATILASIIWKKEAEIPK